jgi:hypothetical protein
MTMAFNIEFRNAEAAARNVTTDIKMLPDLCGVIARAVLAEREACAKVAADYYRKSTLNSRVRSLGQDAADGIAEAIRNR